MRQLLPGVVALAIALTVAVSACTDDDEAPSTSPTPTETATGAPSEGPTERPTPTPTVPGGATPTESPVPTVDLALEAWAQPWDSGVEDGWAWLRLDGGTLFVSVAPPYACCDNFAIRPGLVAALDPDTGDEIWRFDTPAQAFPPVVVEGTLVVGTSDGTVFGLDPGTGGERWRVVFPGVPFQVVEAGGLAIAGDADPETWGPNGIADKSRIRGHVWAIDPADGGVRWRKEYRVFGVFVAGHGGEAFVVSGDLNADGFATALDATSGDERWRTETSAASSPPAVTDELLIVGETTGPLIALEIESGGQAWAAESGSGVVFFPTVEGDVLVAPSNAHGIGLRDLATGRLLGIAEAGDCSMLPVEAADEVAYLHCGRLVVVDPQSASPRLDPLVADDVSLVDAVVAMDVVYVGVREDLKPTVVRALQRVP
jgi:outer membrane protein assembly factor BamB